ncbi:restriction endonuclease subunit S [Polaribacter sp.]|uniref:restriction endonuclease subunit S n=1 Tax=Polaribacter sp. TaxID=1920175 RepID=UPI004047DF99
MSLMRIDEIFSFEKGVLQSSKCVPGDFDFITASSDWKTHKEYTHDCEALIFAAAASGSLGRTHYVNGKFVSSDLCFIITPKDQENLPVDLKFYHILFNELKDEIVRNTKAGTSKEAIGLGSFGKYDLPYFDIDTQIEIKNQFVNSEEIKSSLTTELNEQVGLVKKLRQQLLQDAVQGKLVEQNKKDEPASELLKKIKVEKEKLIAEKKLKKKKELPPIKPSDIPFEIPENWVWCRLGEICTKVTDGFHNTPKKLGEGKIYISATHIREDGIKWSDCLYVSEKDHKELFNKAYPQRGEILITNRGAGCSTPVIIDIDEEFSFQNAALIGFNQQLVSNKYLFYFILKSRDEIMKTFVNGGLQPMLSNVVLGTIPIPFPPLAEQIRIVQKLDELMQYCNELEATIKQSESQNEKLLQQVLREALRKEPVGV